MRAEADCGLGDYAEAERRCDVATRLADSVGDRATAGQAHAVTSVARRCAGRPPGALIAARRARSAAGDSPAGVMALLDEALACAATPGAGAPHAVLDAVEAAEELHATLGHDVWGVPGGYPFGTYHRADLLTYGGAALARVGMYAAAAERLDEAAGSYPADSLELSRVALEQARVALGVGERDAAAEFASAAVTQAQPRPAAWVAGSSASSTGPPAARWPTSSRGRPRGSSVPRRCLGNEPAPPSARTRPSSKAP
jgi:hypothetical protein